jgi:hypothetical protein
MAASNGQTKNSAVSRNGERERQGISNTEYWETRTMNPEARQRSKFKVWFKENVDNKPLVEEKHVTHRSSRFSF